MKKIILMIFIGLLNTLHGVLHIVQFIQSLIMTTGHQHGMEFFDHPAWMVVWSIIGVLSLVIGIRDWRHHRKCNHHQD